MAIRTLRGSVEAISKSWPRREYPPLCLRLVHPAQCMVRFCNLFSLLFSVSQSIFACSASPAEAREPDPSTAGAASSAKPSTSRSPRSPGRALPVEVLPLGCRALRADIARMSRALEHIDLSKVGFEAAATFAIKKTFPDNAHNGLLSASFRSLRFLFPFHARAANSAFRFHFLVVHMAVHSARVVCCPGAARVCVSRGSGS